jgi:arylsulfatase
LFTHLGRWPKGAEPVKFKYAVCSVRTPGWHLVSPSAKGEKEWQLFDVKTDPSEKTDVAAAHPEVVKEMDAAYDQWWTSVQPQLVNERAKGPKVNPFKELFWKQFGGGPDEELKRRMDPARANETLK